MFDKHYKSFSHKAADKIIKSINGETLSPLIYFAAAVLLSLATAFCAGIQVFFAALFFLIMKVMCDAILEYGAHKKKTLQDLSLYLYKFSSAFGFGLIVFVMSAGLQQGLAASFAIFSYFSLLLVTTSNKRGGEASSISPKNLIQDSTALIFLLLILIFPAGFSAFSMFFGLMCWIALVANMFEAVNNNLKQVKATEPE